MTETAGAAPLLLARAAGLDLRSYREEHVAEHVRRAIERERTGDVQHLTHLLTIDPRARARFRRSIAVPVSGMFRDPEQFELLEQKLLPELLADGRRLTVWSAGCADGSELYSLALVLERLDALERSFLLGSDMLEDNIAAARRGVYGLTRIADRLRARMRWERRDLVNDGPAKGKWRLILCRNVSIYFNREVQRKLYAMLAGALGSGGVLMLGRSERIANPGALGLERAEHHAYRRTG
jgi:chemotaxis protein methyltransferase CheR